MVQLFCPTNVSQNPFTYTDMLLNHAVEYHISHFERGPVRLTFEAQFPLCSGARVGCELCVCVCVSYAWPEHHPKVPGSNKNRLLCLSLRSSPGSSTLQNRTPQTETKHTNLRELRDNKKEARNNERVRNI